MNINKIFPIFKSLSDPTRMGICLFLYEEGEVPCSRVLAKFDLAQPTMSHHLSELVHIGILSKRKERVSNYYKLNNQILKKSGIDLGILRKKDDKSNSI